MYSIKKHHNSISKTDITLLMFEHGPVTSLRTLNTIYTNTSTLYRFLNMDQLLVLEPSIPYIQIHQHSTDF